MPSSTAAFAALRRCQPPTSPPPRPAPSRAEPRRIRVLPSPRRCPPTAAASDDLRPRPKPPPPPVRHPPPVRCRPAPSPRPRAFPRQDPAGSGEIRPVIRPPPDLPDLSLDSGRRPLHLRRDSGEIRRVDSPPSRSISSKSLRFLYYVPMFIAS
nr:proline-rich receptor-like protein kinase PERK9 [Aegilops tauschii subsp. strangulata]